MKILVDAFGGDDAPAEVIKGCALAVKELAVQIVLCGDGARIKSCASDNNIDLGAMEIYHSPDVIAMDEDPGEIIKSKKNSSMAAGFRALRDGLGDAFVTAGNSGAAVMGATFLTKRIRGVKRACLGVVVPTTKDPYLLVDAGANVDCKPDMLTQFGLMGSIYMQRVMNVVSPRVGLLNIGSEDGKGGELQIAAGDRLKQAPISYIGNVEARDISGGNCDVLVTDGFDGNIVLKLTEGLSMSLFGLIKEVLSRNLTGKLAGVMAMPGLRSIKARMDYTEHGGAPLIGISKPVIKAHGSSNAKAIKNAIRQADAYARSGAIGEIERVLPAMMKKLSLAEAK